MSAYAESLIKEMRAVSETVDAPPATVYVGGGTPTSLPANLLAKIVTAVNEYFLRGTEAEEFTIEVNPGTVDEKYLARLLSLGANRLSIGAQSFNDALLRRIGRIHTAVEAKKTIRAAIGVGFKNVGVDLMYALPGETTDDVRRDIEEAVTSGARHISVYGLQVEENTDFFRERETGTLDLPSDDETEEMYDFITDTLPRCGFMRYEISNFARENFESRHNLGYWLDTPYIGTGAAAHSYRQNRRFMNTANVEEYIAAVNDGRMPATEEADRDEKIAMAEFCFLALRTTRGIDQKKFAQKFGRPLETVYGDTLKNLRRKDAIREKNGFISLSPLAMKHGNLIFSEFIL